MPIFTPLETTDPDFEKEAGRFVQSFHTPWLIAGTDHNPDKLRCLNEGIYTAARDVLWAMAFREFWGQIAAAALASFAQEVWENTDPCGDRYLMELEKRAEAIIGACLGRSDVPVHVPVLDELIP